MHGAREWANTMYSTPTTWQTARKPHTCSWCGQKIIVGEKYARWANYDDGVVTNKAHEECEADITEAARYEGGTIEFAAGEAERPPKLCRS